MKKNNQKLEKAEWLSIPDKSARTWLSEFLISSLVLKTWHDKHGAPKFIRKDTIDVKDKVSDCGCNCHKGDGEVNFDVRW